MNFNVTAIPDSYPFRGPTDFQPAGVKALFAFGARCAMQGQLWPRSSELIKQLEKPRVVPPDAEQLCPAAAVANFARSLRPPALAITQVSAVTH